MAWNDLSKQGKAAVISMVAGAFLIPTTTILWNALRSPNEVQKTQKQSVSQKAKEPSLKLEQDEKGNSYINFPGSDYQATEHRGYFDHKATGERFVRFVEKYQADSQNEIYGNNRTRLTNHEIFQLFQKADKPEYPNIGTIVHYEMDAAEQSKSPKITFDKKLKPPYVDPQDDLDRAYDRAVRNADRKYDSAAYRVHRVQKR
jgi:hypothetical protein